MTSGTSFRYEKVYQIREYSDDVQIVTDNSLDYLVSLVHIL